MDNLKEYIISSCDGISIDIKEGKCIAVTDIDGGGQAPNFFEVVKDKKKYLELLILVDEQEDMIIRHNSRP